MSYHVFARERSPRLELYRLAHYYFVSVEALPANWKAFISCPAGHGIGFEIVGSKYERPKRSSGWSLIHVRTTSCPCAINTWPWKRINGET